MKKMLLVCASAFALSGCVVAGSTDYVAPSYYNNSYYYQQRNRHHRPICRDVFSGRDYYGRPVYRRVCH